MNNPTKRINQSISIRALLLAPFVVLGLCTELKGLPETTTVTGQILYRTTDDGKISNALSHADGLETVIELAPEPVSPTNAPITNGISSNSRPARIRWRRTTGSPNGISSQTHGAAWDKVYDALAKATPSAYAGDRVTQAEPDFGVARIANPRATSVQAPNQGETLEFGDPANPVWPNRNFGWHLTDQYSQLSSALNVVRARPKWSVEDRPVIAILDVGFGLNNEIDRQVNVIEKLAIEEKSDGTIDPTHIDDISPVIHPGDTTEWMADPGHGTGTLSILAGGTMILPGGGRNGQDKMTLGADPDARIMLVRVGESVIHLDFPWTTLSRMSLGIQYAASVKPSIDVGKIPHIRADVISMSNGGPPSAILAEAVDEAYNHGTAMFFASGDFIVPCPFLWVSSPKSVVYPAAFEQAVAVCGVTADWKSYGQIPSSFSWIRYGMADWKMRGSYGPSSQMGRAICGYSPNTPWASYKVGNDPTSEVDRDGAGTSAATPQVAGAAALWLDYFHQQLVDQGVVGTWKQAELVYAALLHSAKKDFFPHNHSCPEVPDERFGNGAVRALDALDDRFSPTSILKDHPDWISHRPRSTGGYYSELAYLLLTMIEPSPNVPALNGATPLYNQQRKMAYRVKAAIKNLPIISLRNSQPPEANYVAIGDSVAVELWQTIAADAKLAAKADEIGPEVHRLVVESDEPLAAREAANNPRIRAFAASIANLSAGKVSDVLRTIANKALSAR